MLYQKLLTMLPLWAALICPLAQGAAANEEDAGATPSHYSPLTARLTPVEGDTIQNILSNTPTNVLKISKMNEVLKTLNPHARSIEFRDITNAAQKGSATPLTPGRATPKLSDAINADPGLWLDGTLAAVGMPRLDTLFVCDDAGTYLPENKMLSQLLSGEDVFVAATYANAQFQNGVYRLSLTTFSQEEGVAGPLALVLGDSTADFNFDNIRAFMPGQPLDLTVGGTPVGMLTRTPLPESGEMVVGALTRTPLEIDTGFPQLTQRFEALPDDLRIDPPATTRYGAVPHTWYATYLQSARELVANFRLADVFSSIASRPTLALTAGGAFVGMLILWASPPYSG